MAEIAQELYKIANQTWCELSQGEREELEANDFTFQDLYAELRLEFL